MPNCAKLTKKVEIKKKMKKKQKKISTGKRGKNLELASYTPSYTHYTHSKKRNVNAFFSKILNKCFV